MIAYNNCESNWTGRTAYPFQSCRREMFLLNSVLARCISKGILLKAKRKVCLPFNYNCYLSHGQQMSKFPWKITREKVLNSGTGNVGYSQSSHGRRSIVLYTKGEVTRDDSQRRFLANTAPCCNVAVVTIWNNIATMLQRCVAVKIVVANRPV